MTPTRAQRLAGFEAAKKKIQEFVDNLINGWEDFAFSDDEIHQISDVVAEAVLNVNPAGE